MRKNVISLLLIFVTINCFAQNEMGAIDSILNKTASRKTVKLKKIQIGNRRTGTAFFYKKSNKVLFSIVDRKSFYNISGRRDSSNEYKYFFIMNVELVPGKHFKKFIKRSKTSGQYQSSIAFFI